MKDFLYKFFALNLNTVNYLFNNLKFFLFKKLLKKNSFIKLNFFFNDFCNYNFILNFFSKNFKFIKNKKINFLYLNLFNNNQNSFYKFKKYYKNFYSFGLLSLYNLIKYVFISLLFFVIVVYYTILTKLIPFNKVVFSWVCGVMFIYWLVSGFVFFFKKYQFGKYTSVIQRFWKRTYILFWLIEGATFSVFLFFSLNASQESIYMFDQINVFKSHLYSWKLFFLKLFPITLLVVFLYLLLITIKFNFYSKYSIILLLITFFLTNLVWLEFYQFYHVINFYSNLNWNYDQDENFWILEQDPRKTRVVNHYVMVIFILKFWHIIFIYGFWIFFLLRSYEIKRIKYSLLAANFQNIIILYIFTWVFMYPWFKFFFKNLIDSPYYWFYINNRRLFFRILLNDFKLFFYTFNKLSNYSLIKFSNYRFFYNTLSNFEGFKKNFVSNKILLIL